MQTQKFFLEKSIALGLLLSVFTMGADFAMAKENLVLWPVVEGYVQDHGKPVAGLTLTQTVHWNWESDKGGKPRVAVTKTDNKGYFKFAQVDGVANFGFLGKWLHQPGLAMGIRAETGDKIISVYTSMSSSYASVSAPPKPIGVKCDFETIEPFDGRYLLKCEYYEVMN